MDTPGSSNTKPLRIAIIGSGPSAFYAAEALLQAGLCVTVDMIERLPAPFGLVRYGVAPDHPKLKQPIQVFDTIARSPHFTFTGNVTVGSDIAIDELRATHHAIIFACGAQTERQLDIPGESLQGSHTATEFVGWYNGHPDYRQRSFDLSQETVAVIGNGNVAVDVARILTKPIDELKVTDISEHALESLANSRVREVHIVGRRGPAQSKFTNKELRELGEIPDCSVTVSAADLELNEASAIEVADKRNFAAAKNVEILRSWANRAAQPRQKRIVFHFLASPSEFVGPERVNELLLQRNALRGAPFVQEAFGTDRFDKLQCGLVFRSIGYQGVPLTGVPFDNSKCVFPNEAGRINAAPGLYATGWIKRGPSGIIGTNRACAVDTVGTLLSDLQHLEQGPKAGIQGLRSLLFERGVRSVSYGDWLRIDAEEVERGAPKGKPREKFTRVAEMLSVLEG